MQWSAWRLSARLASSSWVYRVLTLWTVACLIVGITWYAIHLTHLRATQGQGSFVFHYTVYLGIDDVRPMLWLMVWPLIWLVTSLAILLCAYGTYRRDLHAGMAWLALAALSALPWMLALRYLALINT